MYKRQVKRCSKLDRIADEAIREELLIFNEKCLNEKLKYYKQRWKERLERMSDSRLAKQVWKYKPIGHRCVGRSYARQAAPWLCRVVKMMI